MLKYLNIWIFTITTTFVLPLHFNYLQFESVEPASHELITQPGHISINNALWERCVVIRMFTIDFSADFCRKRPQDKKTKSQNDKRQKPTWQSFLPSIQATLRLLCTRAVPRNVDFEREKQCEHLTSQPSSPHPHHLHLFDQCGNPALPKVTILEYFLPQFVIFLGVNSFLKIFRYMNWIIDNDIIC